MDQKKPIDHLIEEWFRERCHEKWNNIPRELIRPYLIQLFQILKDAGYTLEDLSIFEIRKIKKMCRYEDGAKRVNKERWENDIESGWAVASREIFPSKDAPIGELPEVPEAPEPESKPIDTSLIKKDVVECKYDEELASILGEPEGWRE